jgi:hypothetical protein
MLDGKRYYAVFPDESPEMQDRMRSLFDALKKLERAFRQMESFRGESNNSDYTNKPAG